MRIYIAGPYTHPDPVENTHKAIKVADVLVSLGHNPYIPHLTLMWHLVSPKPVEFWYAYDMAWLKLCEGLLRLPGESSGADKEVAWAEANGIPVYYNIAAIPSPSPPLSDDQMDKACEQCG